MSLVHGEEHAFCPVHDGIDPLLEKWVLQIVRALLDGPHGFNELARTVGGVDTTTRSARLERLKSAGIVAKTIESTMPPTTRYEFTPSWHALQRVIDAIGAWGRDRMLPSGVAAG